MQDMPRQLHDLAPAPGLIKADYKDFVVEELPLYAADGAGTHTYFLVEKAGLSTTQAVRDIARALNVPRHDIGFAGQKDSRAVTRQWMSIEHVEPDRVQKLDIPRLKILETTRHHNKLRLGHLQGNAFIIKVRQTDTNRLAQLQDALQQLARDGVPNYFGSQRFGYRGDTWAVGRAILLGEIEEAVDIMLGRPGPADEGTIRTARELYDRGEYVQAARHWPVMFHTERKALKWMAGRGQRRRGFAAVDKSTRLFCLSAYQSHLFNRVVAARLPSGLGQLWEGDLAWRHANGAVFTVADAALEQPRADSFEISPSGPLFGYRMTEPTGQAGTVEADVLTAEDLRPASFRKGAVRVKGGRRPLRFQVADPRLALGADDSGPYLDVRFVLPRGCYATALLRELFRVQMPGAAEAENEESETAS
jgi:tRNA pseudouridine13 synthase